MFSAGFRQQNKMEEDRNDSGYSADYTNESRDRHEDRRRRDRDRDRDYDRSRGRDRDRRRSKSRSRSRSRSRERDGDRRKRRDRYDDDSRYNAEGSRNSGDRSKPVGKQRQDKDWRMRLTSIRDAHFNRSKQPPSIAQNQFTNDGSFLEKFKMMAEGNSNGSSVMPNSLVLASSSIKYSPEISLPPLTTLPEPSKPSTSATEDQDLDGVPIKKPIPVPVSVGRRRNVKPLKTGVVFKKTQQSEEDEASQEKLDAWSRYLQEVQKYKNDNCVEEDSSRPLVK